MKQVPIDWSDKIIEPSGKRLSPVKEATIYPSQASHFLRERLQGQSVAQAAERLGVKTDDLVRMLDGTWKPSKDVCQRLGLRMVYAIEDVPASDASVRAGAHTGAFRA